MRMSSRKSPARRPLPRSSPETDDLTDLTGVGQAYAEDLAAAEIETFEQLAAADVAELAAETGISPSRIEDWIDQARDE